MPTRHASYGGRSAARLSSVQLGCGTYRRRLAALGAFRLRNRLIDQRVQSRALPKASKDLLQVMERHLVLPRERRLGPLLLRECGLEPLTPIRNRWHVDRL